MHRLNLRRLLCSFVITAGASACATGEMHRIPSQGDDGPSGESSSDALDTSDDGADSAADSDPSGTDPSATDPSDPSDPSATDPSDTDPSATDPTDTAPSDSGDTDPTDTDPTDTDPTDGESTDTGSTSDATDATDDTTSAGVSVTDTDPTDTDPTDATDSAGGEPVDLSGWVLVQTASAREFVIPDGTIVPRGGYLIVGRDASPGAFQDFWAANWGDEVVYLDTADGFPTINGLETFALRDPQGVVVDGPTPALELSTGWSRLDADMDAGDLGAWDISVAPNDTASPGAGGPLGAVSGTPHISEFVDPTGAGNFVYEFVEIYIAP